MLGKAGQAPALVSEAIFEARLLPVCDCVCLYFWGNRKKQIWFPNHQALQALLKPRPSSSSCFSAFLRCSFANMVPLPLRLLASIIHTAPLSEIGPKTGQPVQARDGSIRLFDCREWIQSNFNWQVERIPETFLLSPKHTRSKSKKGAAVGRVAVQHA